MMASTAGKQAESRRYAKITLQKRLDLIHIVEQEGLSIAKTASKLGIKLSTAKLIIYRYRRTGTVFEAAPERKARLLRERGPSSQKEFPDWICPQQAHAQEPSHCTNKPEWQWGYALPTLSGCESMPPFCYWVCPVPTLMHYDPGYL